MISVHIQISDDGQVRCAASVSVGQDVTGKDLITLLGGMQVASLSLAAGRWGLMEAKPKKNGVKRGRVAFNPFNKDWERLLPPLGKDKSHGT